MSEAFEKMIRLLESGVQNIVQSSNDEFCRKNAEFRAKAGLEVVIIRESLGKCCSWCSELEGTYTYDTAPDDVYARHRGCRCVVSTKTKKGTYQDAWSKKHYNSYRENRIAREKEIISEQDGKQKPDFYVGENGKVLKQQYAEWIGQNRMREYLANAEGELTKIYIKSDFRPKSFIGDGSTADIRKFEIHTGINCGRNGGNHAIKVKDLIRQINKTLLKDISQNDKIFLEKQLERLMEVDI